MLEAAIEELNAQTAAFLAPINTSMLGSAQDGIELGRRRADMLRILFRDLADFPDIQRRVVDDMVETVYQVAADRTAIIAPNGDSEALAVVMSNAMLGFTLMESVLGVSPLGVDADRFAAAWARILELLIADELSCEEPE